MDGNVEKVKEAVARTDKPMAVVIPHGSMTATQSKQFLIDAGLWYLK